MKRIAIALAALLVVAHLVAAVWGWSIVRRGFSAREEPSAAEAWLARKARQHATPAAWRELRNPQPATPENVRDGLEHFADHCAMCHANNGSGDTALGKGMYPKPPDMRTGITQNLTDGEIYAIIQNGIRLTGMPAFGEAGRKDDPGTWNLVHFIRHLPRLTAEEEAEMRRLNPKSAHELQEQQEIDDFLRDDSSEAISNHEPKKEKK